MSASLDVFRCIASVGSNFAELTEWLRSVPAVDVVRHPTRIELEGAGSGTDSSGAAYAEWFCDAEFSDGRALSFGLEVEFRNGQSIVTSTVRVSLPAGQDDLFAPEETRYATEDDAVADLPRASRALVDRRVEALVKMGGTPA